MLTTANSTVEALVVDTLGVDSSAVEAAAPESPAAESPAAVSPEVDAHEVDAHEVDAHEVDAPGVEVRQIVQRVLWTLKSSHKRMERRRAQRHAYPYPLRIWPAGSCRVSQDGTIEPEGEGLLVMGKHLSTGGLDFYTREPIADRKIVASLDCGEGQSWQVLVELTWCRFGGHGMYVNGGRFLRALDSTP